MKNLKTLLIAALSVSFLFTACEGPEGIPGRDGLNGENAEITKAFEIANVTFDNSNNHTVTIPFVDFDLNVLNSDIVLVYRQNGEDPANGDMWQLLPQNFFINEGTLVHNFNHTKNDFQIAIDSNFDINTINNASKSQLLDNQVFRIAVIPAALKEAKVLNSYYEYSNIIKDAKLLNFTE